ncbi:MAG: hypothetical protein EBR69_03580 [Synechococcaceae bacterium WB4_2_0805]|nr:hypothetical protein [Synechococcaceae bacterium WB4_2_0805]
MLGKASTVFSAPSCGWAGSNSRVSWFRVLTGLCLPQFGLAAGYGRYLVWYSLVFGHLPRLRYD